MAGTLVGTSLIAQGLLQMASQGGDSSSGSSGGSGRGSGTSRGTQSDWEAASVRSGRFTEADLPRLREVAKDAAHGGRVTKGSWEEAEVGLGLEESGAVRGLLRSTHPGEEFVDGARRSWDVKAFRSNNFDLDTAMATMRRKLDGGIDVMMDSRHLNADQVAKLTDAVERAGWGRRVLWWP